MGRARGIVVGAIFALAVVIGAAVIGGPADRSAKGAARAKGPTRVTTPVARVIPAARTTRARDALASRLGSVGVLQQDPNSGGVRMLARLDGYLTKPAKGDPADIALRYVREHERVFGGKPRGLHLVERKRRGHLWHLRWQQRVRGIPLLGSGLRAAVRTDGRILQIAEGPRPKLNPNALRPAFGPRHAAAIAAKRAGVKLPSVATLKRVAGRPAELVLTNRGRDLTLAWRVVIPSLPEAAPDALIDARTGRVLELHDDLKALEGRAFDFYPGASVGGTATLRDFSAWLDTSATTLSGTYAHAFSDLNGNGHSDQTGDPNTEEDVGPSDTATGVWDYARQTFTPASTFCGTPGCSWDPGDPTTVLANRAQAATQVFYFVNRFYDHLRAAPIGFSGSEAFEADDPVQAGALSGAYPGGGAGPDDDHINNAGMFTPPEGASPTMEMYLFKPDGGAAYSATSGGDEAPTVFHEATHGLVGRLVTDSTGWDATSTAQAGAANEALADFYALDFVTSEGAYTDTATPGEIDLSPLTEHGLNLGRHQPIDCAVDATGPSCPGFDGVEGGFTYANFAQLKSPARAEVHADGEIFGETLWDLRRQLIADHGATDGVARARKLITDALRLAPPHPSFLDLRNAIVEADFVSGEADADAIWLTFTNRGMGWFAGSDGSDDLAPRADFSLPPGVGPTGTVTGQLIDRATGNPVSGVRVAVNGHETHGLDEVDTFAGSLFDFTDSEGHYSITLPPGDYDGLHFTLPGWQERYHPSFSVADGGTTTVDDTIRRNWADTRSGATITSISGKTGPPSGQLCANTTLADGDRNTGVLFNAAAPTRRFTVQLPQAVRVSSFAVDPTARCFPRANPSTTSVVVETSSDGSSWKQAADASFDRGNLRRFNEIRPTAPISDVRYVRVTLGGPIDPGFDFVGLAEFQVFAVPKRAPVAAFQSSPALPKVDEQVTFDASASVPGDALITGYGWDLDGDGSYETTGGAQVTKTFTRRGAARVGLMVTDANGETDEFSKQVYIGSDAIIYPLDDDAGTDPSRGLRANGHATVAGGRYTGGDPPAGESGGGGTPHAVRFSEGALENLQPLTGGDETLAFDVDGAGNAYGYSTLTGTSAAHAVRWPQGSTSPVDLGFSVSNNLESLIVGASEAGDVAGYRDDGTRFVPIWAPAGGPEQDIQTVAGVQTADRRAGRAIDVNSAGLVVGCWLVGNGPMCSGAFKFAGSTLTDLPGLGGAQAAALGVTSNGDLAGAAMDSSAHMHAVIWDSDTGQPADLGTLGGANAQALALNDDLDAVGYAQTLSGESHAFLRTNGGAITDLNDLVADSGWTLHDAAGITARREITGTGTLNGRKRAYELDAGDCRICVDHVDIEHQAPAAGGLDWQTVGAQGTVDGNQVRFTLTLRNDDDIPHTVTASLRDRNRNETLSPDGQARTLNAGETAEVQWSWDSEGRAWSAAHKPDSDHLFQLRVRTGRRLHVDQILPLKVRPKPVVLVHGMASDASTWHAYRQFLAHAHPDARAYAVGDLQAPGAMNTGSWSDPENTNTLSENVAILNSYVGGVRAATNAARIDLVAHSMGGLISREWIQDDMPSDPVPNRPVAAHLIQIGTPNQGSACAEWFEAPMTYALRPDVVSDFNDRVTDRRGVRFSVLAGAFMPTTCGDPSLGDGVVSVPSAWWTIADRQLRQIRHTAMTEDPDVFSDYVLPRLNTTVTPPAARVAARAALETPSLTAAPGNTAVGARTQLLGTATQSVGAGADVTIPLNVPAVDRLDVALMLSPGMSARLLDGNGAEMDASAADEQTPLLTADNPTAGTWSIAVHNGGDAGSATWSAKLSGDDRRLRLAVGAPGSDGAVRVALKMTNGAVPVTGGSATATFSEPDGGGSPTAVTLFDDGSHNDGAAGDGCYAGLSGPIADGDHRLRVDGTGGGASRAVITVAATAAPATGGPGTPVCPRGAGANGLLISSNVYAQEPATQIDTTTGAVTPFMPDLHPDERTPLRWSPDGTKLALIRDGSKLVIHDLSDDSESQVIDIATTVCDECVPPRIRDFRWSPDGEQFVYWTSNDLWITNADGTANHPLVLDTFESSWDNADWSPDGDRIVAARYLDDGTSEDGYTQIVDMAVDGSNKRVLASEENMNPTDESLFHDVEFADPVYSPDGSRIAFRRHWEIVTPTPGPDGSYVSEDWSIRTIPADGGSAHVVAHDSSEIHTYDHAEWSPDGRFIAFLSYGGWTNASTRVFLAGNGGVTPLTPDVDSASTPDSFLSWQNAPLVDNQVAPTCQQSVQASVEKDKSATILLPCNDANGDGLSLSLVSQPSHGTLGPLQSDSTVVYTPAAGFTGTDSFTFKANDGKADSNVGTVTITVSEPPPPYIPPPFVPTFGSSSGGSSSGGGGGGGGGGGDNQHITGTCTYGSSGCPTPPVGPCPPGGSNCSGSAGGGGGSARVSVAGAAKTRLLFKPLKFKLAPGKSKRLHLKLTKAARKTLAKKKKLRFKVYVTLRQDGKIVQRSVFTMNVKAPKKKRR